MPTPHGAPRGGHGGGRGGPRGGLRGPRGGLRAAQMSPRSQTSSQLVVHVLSCYNKCREGGVGVRVGWGWGWG